jgi:hypothetical protein
VPDWGVILLAAVCGALAGAVLQLALSYVERNRAQEGIRSNRKRRLRWMLEAWMVHGRMVASGSFLLAYSKREGLPGPTPQELQEQFWRHPQAPLWQPERIDDMELQLKARDYADTMNRLSSLLLSDSVHEAERLKLVERLESLQGQITNRMDDLHWPEIHE